MVVCEILKKFSSVWENPETYKSLNYEPSEIRYPSH